MALDKFDRDLPSSSSNSDHAHDDKEDLFSSSSSSSQQGSQDNIDRSNESRLFHSSDSSINSDQSSSSSTGVIPANVLDINNDNDDDNARTSLQEEIVLNETILESLQKRMISLDQEIALERSQLLRHSEQLEFMKHKKISLKRAREENTVLLRGVTHSLDRCIKTLRRKLDDKGYKPIAVGEIISSVDSDTGAGANIMIEDMNASSDSVMEHHDNLRSSMKTKIGGKEIEMDHAGDGVIHTIMNNIEIEEACISAVTNISIEIKSPFDEQYMQQRWSQSYPDHIPLFHGHAPNEHSLLPSEYVMRPLHHPFTSSQTLSKVVEYAQSEAWARREKMTEVELKIDYRASIQETVLDVYACTTYDPHLIKSNGRVEAVLPGVSLPVNDGNLAVSTANGPKIDANMIICRKALFGKCNDPLCAYQHLSGRANVKTRSNKLRTVESNQHGCAVILPIFTYPIPPFPKKMKDVVRLEESGEGSSHLCTHVKEEDDLLSDRKDSSKDIMDGDSSIEDSVEEDLLSKPQDSSENIMDCDSSIEDSVENIEEEQSNILNNASIDNEDSAAGIFSEMAKSDSGNFGDTEDYIVLPDIEDDEVEGRMSTNIKIALSDCEESEEDVLAQEHDHENELNQDAPGAIGVFTDALKMLGFEIMSVSNIEQETQPILTYNPQIQSLSGSDMDPLIIEANLLCSVVSGVQLCIHAGRVDCSEGILQLARSSTPLSHSDPSNNRFVFTQVVVNYLTILHQGSTCGKGGLSSNCSFHIQFALSVLSHFAKCNAQSIVLITDCANYDLCVSELERQLKACMDLLLQVGGQDLQEGKTLSALITEIETYQPIFSNLSPLESCTKLSESITLGQHLAIAIANEASTLNDPQLILEKVLFHVCNFLKSASFKCSKLMFEASQHSQSTMQLNIFSFFGPAIFTGVSSIVSVVATESLRDNMSKSTLLPRHEGIFVQVKQLLMESIQYLDFSGTIVDNKEGQLLLCPFFSILAQILVACSLYTKAHVLLVNALHSAHSERNWGVFSDLLWSSLIQLHMIFPLPESLEENRADLSTRPLDYGINPSKMVLTGDSTLVNCLLLGKIIKAKEGKARADFKRIQQCCEHISLAGDKSQKTIPHNYKCVISLGSVNEHSDTVPMHAFPHSLYFLGDQMKSLTFTCCGLESLPIRFGDYFPQLKVSSYICASCFDIFISCTDPFREKKGS
jgi:hypothetical protein